MVNPIDPGEFRTPIILQTLATTGKDAVGQPITAWTDVAAVWAGISPLNAREQFWAQQTHATTTHRISMRYDSRVTPDARFKLGDRIFNIESVLDLDERRIYMVVSATEQIPSET